MKFNDNVIWVQSNMVNLNVIDFGKGDEWEGLWSKRNEWDGLWSERSKMKYDQWS